MYLLLMERMQAAGYKQYEISNFAKPGFESRHNMTYWRNEDYYGLGAGAHGYIGRQRHVNIKGVNPYNETANQGLPDWRALRYQEKKRWRISSWSGSESWMAFRAAGSATIRYFYGRGIRRPAE